jgi:hypothetical protein
MDGMPALQEQMQGLSMDGRNACIAGANAGLSIGSEIPAGTIAG